MGTPMTPGFDEPALRRKLLKGARWSVGLRLVSQLYTWGVTLFMVRLLTPADYGLNAMLEAPIELLALVGAMGLDTALVRFGVKSPRQISSTFGLLLLVNASIFVGLMAGAPWIAGYFKQPDLEALVRVSAVVFVLAPLRTIPNALLDIALDFKLKAQVELQATVLSSLVGLALAFMGGGVWALVAIVVVGAVLRVLLLAWRYPWFVVPTFSWTDVRELLRYGATVLATGLILVATGKIYSVVGGPSLGTQVLGIYAVASLFSYLPLNKTMPIVQQTLLPAFAQLSGQPEVLKRYLLYSLELCGLTIVPLGIGMAACADLIVATFFGEAWAQAAAPLAILSLLTPLRLLGLIFQSPLNAIGHAGVVTGMALVNFCAFLIGIWWVLDMGLMGLVWLAVSIASMSALLWTAVARRLFGLTLADLAATLGAPLVACAVMAASVWAAAARLDGWRPGAALVAVIALGIVVYVCTIALMRGRRVVAIVRTLLGR